MQIPRVIHQTWRTKEIPARFKAFADSWRCMHSSWQFLLWDDRDNDSFIADHFPWFARFYRAYPFDIQRVDAVRYFILLKYGGIYLDLDFECLRPIDELLTNEQCVFSFEPKEHARIHKQPYIISNAFMAAAPQHPFFSQVIKDLIFYRPRTVRKNDLVLETTGPFLLNRAYEHFDAKSMITLLPSSLLLPLTYWEAEKHLHQVESDCITRKLQNAFGLHYHWGSWWHN